MSVNVDIWRTLLILRSIDMTFSRTLITKIRTLFVCMACFVWLSQLAQAKELFPEVMPNPAYQPEEVVGIQMRALAKNNLPLKMRESK